MLMKQTSYIFAFLLALLCGVNVARADIVENYLMDFNTRIDTNSKHDFKVGTGWAHITDTYNGSYCSYYYYATGGIDGSGALQCNDQTSIGGDYLDDENYGSDVYDLLVTPKVSGNVSFYLKAYGYGSSFVQVYNVVNDNGKLKKGDLITLPSMSLSRSEYKKVELPAQDGAYLGIRLVNCYIDNFAADKAEVELSKSLQVISVVNNVSGNPICNEEGKFLVDCVAKITNNGDLDLKASDNDPNYSLSVVNYSKDNAVCFTVPVTVDLAKGASADVNITGYVDYATYPDYNRYDVMENFTKSTKYLAWYTPVPHKPILVVQKGTSNMDAGETVAWGKLNKKVEKTFRLRNTGGAALENTTVSVPDGFECSIKEPFSLEPQKDSVFTIAALGATVGEYSGEVSVSGTGIDAFKFKVSATVLDPTKFYANFEDNKIPEGCLVENNGWTTKQINYTTADNIYALGAGTQYATDKFITPLLKVAEGDKMTFDVGRMNRSVSGAGSYLNVYYSKDRRNWVLADSISSAVLSSDRLSSNGSYGVATQYTLDKIPAGNYYIGFGAGYTYIDNIYGYEKLDVAHDWAVTEAAMPSVATVNHKYTATVKLRNVNTKDEAADSYTASLYVGDKAVATAEAKAIKAGADSVYTFSFMPHEALAAKAYAVFSVADGSYKVSSDSVNLVVAAESSTGDVQVGAVTGSGYNDKESNRVPLYWYEANGNGAMSDMLYTPKMLNKYGIVAGNKINSITFKGEPNSAKTLDNVELLAKVEAIDSLSWTPGSFSDNVQDITVLNKETIETKVGEDLVTTIQLPTPIVWDGTSSIHVYTQLKAGTWLSVYYDIDAGFNSARYKKAGATSYSNTYVPVAYFAVQTEPSVISGTVKCGNKPVADATVELRSEDDVLYSGKTDEAGAYSFPVIQTDKVYTLTATADKYVTYTKENISLSSSIEENIEMQLASVSVSGSVTYRKVGLAGATVTLTTGSEPALTATTAADGNYAFAEVAPGKNYMLKVTADKFTDYTSADSILIAADTTFSAVEMTKAPVAVSGMVLFRNSGLKDVTVTLSRGETTLTATTGEDGTYKFDAVAPDCNYALTAKAAKFNDYAAADSVAVLAATELDDIVMTKPNFKIYGQLKWGNTPVSGVIAQITWVSSTGDNMKWGDFTKADGKFEFSNLDANCVYTLNVIDLNKEFEDQPEVATIESGEDTEENVSLVIKPVSVTVPASGYVAYSYKRGLDFSGATGLTAYAVSDVVKNYTVLSEVSEAPANTGLILKAAPGTYELTPVETAAPVSENKLVAVQGSDVTIGSDNVGKIWAMTESGALTVFKSEQGTTISKGGAYLAVESTEPVIYLSQTDGISSVDGSNGGILDESKPMYNLAGQKVGKNYKGVVIQNGRKYNK